MVALVYVLGDGLGSLATIRGTPKKLDIVPDARANGGRIRPEGDAKVDLQRLQERCPMVMVKTTIDAMVFNCTKREAYGTRRAGGVTPWKKFTFPG